MDPQLFCEPSLCKAAFRVLDTDGDGVITATDLEQVLTNSSDRQRTAEEIIESTQKVLEESGSAGHADGKIDFQAFCNAMLPPGSDPNLAVKVAEYMSKSFV